MDGILIDDRHAGALDRLRHLGETVSQDWPDYLGDHGIGPDHVDALIDMACDPELHAADGKSDLVWAPVHAWRALGQLRAASCVEPLLELLRTLDDDSLDIEAPIVFGMIGPAAIPAIKEFVSDRSVPTLPAANALSGLQHIADRHPGHRSECIDLLLQPLSWPDPNHELNGFAISSLLDLHALDALEPIRDAFRRDIVDISVAGDLEDVEIDLGVRTHRDTPKPHYVHTLGMYPPSPSEPIRHEKIGRNQPCPCGSGRKYKKCCLH